MLAEILSSWDAIAVWALIPLLIFIARILDVSIGTLKLILISRGMKHIAPVLSFFEILIWLTAISQIMQNLNDPLKYLAYAAGFSAGTFIGMILEEKLALGSVILQIITNKDTQDLARTLKQEGYGYTQINADGNEGPVSLTFTVIQRKRLPHALKIIKEHNPHAFYTIEDVKHVSDPSITPQTRKEKLLTLLKRQRKGK